MKRHLLICCLFLWVSCGRKQDTIFPVQTRLIESVYSSVIIQPDSLYQAYAAVSGIVERNLVEEGDTVSNGTPLVQIINNTPKINTENAKISLQLAQENFSGSSAILNSIRDEIHSAQLSLNNDSILYFRQKNLWEQNIGSKAQFENKELAYELSRNKLQLLKNSFERTKNELYTNLQQARNNFRTSQIFTKDYTVTSKIHGIVYALFKNPGEIVTTMEPLASVGSADNFIIELLVDEVDIVKIVIGQKTLVTLDAYNLEVFEAEISKIYPQKDERSQTFKVEAIFTHPPNQLYAGLAGEGNIIIEEKDNVLTIPRDYLVNGDRVITQDGIKKVRVGLQNLEEVEILDGIDQKTKIFKPEQ